MYVINLGLVRAFTGLFLLKNSSNKAGFGVILKRIKNTPQSLTKQFDYDF